MADEAQGAQLGHVAPEILDPVGEGERAMAAGAAIDAERLAVAVDRVEVRGAAGGRERSESTACPLSLRVPARFCADLRARWKKPIRLSLKIKELMADPASASAAGLSN
jgi:hypothetical protein